MRHYNLVADKIANEETLRREVERLRLAMQEAGHATQSLTQQNRELHDAVSEVRTTAVQHVEHIRLLTPRVFNNKSAPGFNSLKSTVISKRWFSN